MNENYIRKFRRKLATVILLACVLFVCVSTTPAAAAWHYFEVIPWSAFSFGGQIPDVIDAVYLNTTPGQEQAWIKHHTGGTPTHWTYIAPLYKGSENSNGKVFHCYVGSDMYINYVREGLNIKIYPDLGYSNHFGYIRVTKGDVEFPSYYAGAYLKLKW